MIYDVARPQILDVAGLRALPSKTVNVTFNGPHGAEHHLYVGPLLLDVLARPPRSSPRRSRTTKYAISSV